ncbi:Bidirectional sugar transporter SWEET [Quillaja saponaria]|uniref:Bidirectional sugar transporter SWEET n=1 Tax=Quillaja saponaria TaxID=32244 RepID=A0AAD7VJC2_QUISA|nr:Bidirectional sugar transporter SWEET [Quillaja saponaria]
MASISFIFAIIGNVISILVFASPIKTFRLVVKKKSTENYKVAPYITTLLSTSLWSFYGLLKPDGLLVVTVNGAGAVLQFIYVILFLIYAPKDKKVKTAQLAGHIECGIPWGSDFSNTFGSPWKQETYFGWSIMHRINRRHRTVIKTQSVEYMPFLLSFFLFLNAGIWTAYAILVSDYYIGIANAIGFLLGSAQLIIYVIYKNKSTVSAKSKKELEEEGSVTLVKEASIEMMQAYDEDEDDDNDANKSSLKDGRLINVLRKGKSLPKPTLGRQQSMKKILKTLSVGAYNLPSSWVHQDA